MKKFSEWLKVREAFGPYIGPCVNTDTYQVFGACSDQNTEAQNKKYRLGQAVHRKIHGSHLPGKRKK